MKTGIRRIRINSQPRGRGAWRFIESQRRWPLAEVIYRQIFDDLNPLLPDREDLNVSPEDFEAGYDKYLGIDIELNHQSGMTSTLQEKILFTEFRTVTIEYMNNPDEEGDWFNLKADYYFVGYDRTDKAESLQDWILLDWRKVKELTGKNLIPWKERPNQNDGAQATFKYVDFDKIPLDCIVAKSKSTKDRLKKLLTPEQIAWQERNSILNRIGQAHLNPGWNLHRVNQVLTEYGITLDHNSLNKSAHWDKFNVEQLQEIESKLT